MINLKLNADDFLPARKSDINLDKGVYSGDIGLGGNFYIKSLYSDFILIEYIDVNQSGQREEDGLLVPMMTNEMHWRKGIVRLVGPAAQHTHIGDIVCFPNDKGLKTAQVSYIGTDKKVHSTDNGIFLDERRLFAKLNATKE